MGDGYAELVGITSKRVTVSNLADPSQSFADDFVVDTGALFSFAPKDRLLAIGVRPTRTERLRLADGTIVARAVGDAFFEVAGKRAAAPIIFAEPGDATLLGAVSLEALALGVNPVSQQLEPVVLLAVGATRA